MENPDRGEFIRVAVRGFAVEVDEEIREDDSREESCYDRNRIKVE